jgi:hypothetical protein
VGGIVGESAVGSRVVVDSVDVAGRFRLLAAEHDVWCAVLEGKISFNG